MTVRMMFMRGWLEMVGKALGALGLIKKPKKTAAPVPLPAVTRDDARAEADRRDELRRRRGGAADLVTGAGGAEAGATGKTVLG